MVPEDVLAAERGLPRARDPEMLWERAASQAAREPAARRGATRLVIDQPIVKWRDFLDDGSAPRSARPH